MGNNITHRGIRIEAGESLAEIKRQIFEKVRRKMIELGLEKCELQSPANEKESPDVIVISDDQSLLFEPQNLQVTEWLRGHFGMENLGIRDRIRVHPTQSWRVTIELKAAGFEVV